MPAEVEARLLELRRIHPEWGPARIPLLIVDEVGYISFDPEAGALFFALMSSRYERRSLVVNATRPSVPGPRSSATPWPVAAMVDRLVHHAEVIVLRGESRRLRGKRKEVLQSEGAS